METVTPNTLCLKWIQAATVPQIRTKNPLNEVETNESGKLNHS